MKTGNQQIHAGEKVAAPAAIAGSVVTAMPTHADAIPDVPLLDTRTDGVDDSGNFVSRRTRKRHTGPSAVDGHDVAVADAAGLNADADRSGTRFGNRQLA